MNLISILIRFILATIGAFLISLWGVFSLIGLFIFTFVVCWFLITFIYWDRTKREIGYMDFLKSDFALQYGWILRMAFAFSGGFFLFKGGYQSVIGVVFLVLCFGWISLNNRMQKLEDQDGNS